MATVARVQSSGWDASSFGTFAGDNGIGLRAGQLTQISVDGASPSIRGGDGDVEAALDQETILGQAPAALQRAYFGPNTAQRGRHLQRARHPGGQRRDRRDVVLEGAVRTLDTGRVAYRGP